MEKKESNQQQQQTVPNEKQRQQQQDQNANAASSGKWMDFFDTSKPWVLNPDGKCHEFFEFVPVNFRVGPWNIGCCLYLAFAFYWVLLMCVNNLLSSNPPGLEEGQHTETQYFPAYSWAWWYNVFGFCWTAYIAYAVSRSDMGGWFIWMSFTMQSWALLLLRHGLSAMAPFSPMAATLSEYLRFPSVAQASTTFTIFHFVLLPAMIGNMKTTEEKQGFIKIVTSWLVFNVHAVNLALAAASGILGSPARELDSADFSVALWIALMYVSLYLFVLDRIGAHFYFIFSPRSPLAFVTWTFFVGTYFGWFSLWKRLILKYGISG